MKMKLTLLVAGLFLAATSSALATLRYVNINNANPTPPFLTWATAATNIQNAVDAAGAGDEVEVTNGVYAPVTVDTPLTLQSVNGPDFTVIDGLGTLQCLYLTNDAVVVGFTLTNGWAWGNSGGVYCESTSAVLSNCVLTGNLSWSGGGGANGGTLNNCTLTGNLATGGFIFGVSFGGFGGGACNCTLNGCTLSGNSALYGGGAADCTLNNCTLIGNSVHILFAPGSDVGPTLSGGAGGGAYNCTLNNCTLTGNSAGGGGGTYSCALNNCIVYFNSGDNYDPSSTLNYCCTTPMPPSGVGNISADPQLASASHLSAESPCIGAGSSRYASGTDIDGDPWANPPSIGCDEYHAGAVTGPLTVAISADYTNVATGFPVGLTALIEGLTDLSVWDFGGGLVAVNQPCTSHTWTAPGDYLVALWSFNESYPGGVSATVTVHVVEDLQYVAASSDNPLAPYTSWATAATKIQDAVDVALPGGTIFVTNGTYAAGGRTTPSPGDGATNRVAVDKPLVLRSVNGPDVTVIDGGGAVRCLYLTNAATLVGFTLTNGVATFGSGVYCESTSAVLSNCVLTGNSAFHGGGAYGGTLNNCTLTGNSADSGSGAGAWDSTLNSCAVSGNTGGGAGNCSLNNCTLTGNSAYYGGGGAMLSTLNNCTLTANSAVYGGGAWGGTLNNCTLTGNSAEGGGGAADSILNDCTLTGNTATNSGGGASSDGYQPCALNNCIVYFNSDTNGGNYDASSTLNYCCTTPLPTNGVGNITNAPLFVNYAGGSLRLQSNSPCINSGNNAYVVGSTDLDGNPRIVGGTVDIGAYEYQTPVSMISYAWLQQYGLPTDGSADFTDPDHDGMNNWQEWIAGTNPTNAASVLKMLAPVKTNSPAGLVVTWQSVNTRAYYLQSSTNLAAHPAFTTLQSNIVGQVGTTSYTNTNAGGSGPFFYRVGVEN